MIGKYKLNNIYNEDSYIAIKNIPDKSIDCIYTDLPYLMDKHGIGNSELGQRMKKQSIELKDIDKGCCLSILDEFVRVLKKINIFIWCSKLQILDILTYFNNIQGTRFEIIVWKKNNPTPNCNNKWLSDLEYCLYFRESGVVLNDGYTLKTKWYASAINKSDKDKFDHPTIKPLDLVRRHILHTTQPNDIVADFFNGSGTSTIASELEGRRYIGFEINKKWYDISINRHDRTDSSGQQSLFLF